MNKNHMSYKSGCVDCGKMNPLFPDNRCSGCSKYNKDLTCCTCYYLYKTKSADETMTMPRFELQRSLMNYITTDCQKAGSVCKNYHNSKKVSYACRNEHPKILPSHYRK